MLVIKVINVSFTVEAIVSSASLSNSGILHTDQEPVEIESVGNDKAEIVVSGITSGSVSEVCTRLKLDENTVSEYLGKREIKQYIDQVYLDTGYRNRFKLASTLDTIIEEKLAEAEESQMYTNKDVADLLQMAHKMRMDEIKAMAEMEKAKTAPIKQQANIQINELPFGQGNYGKLMEKLIGDKD